MPDSSAVRDWEARVWPASIWLPTLCSRRSPDEYVAFTAPRTLHVVGNPVAASLKNGKVSEDQLVGHSGRVLLWGGRVGGVGNCGILNARTT